MLSYFIRRPDKTRRTFSIYKQQKLPDKKTKNETIKNFSIDEVNDKFLTGKMALEEAEFQIKSIQKSLNSSRTAGGAVNNEILLDNFLLNYFKSRPFIVDKRSATNKFRRAVKALGGYPLDTVTAHEVIECMLKVKGNEQQREVAHKINSIFKFMNRQIRIPVPPKEWDDVNYLTECELLKLTANIENSGLKSAITLSFYSGVRIGELRALTKSKLLPNEFTISITEQLDRNEQKRLPKNRKRRKAFLHNKGLASFNEWVSRETTPTHARLNKLFVRACKKILGRSNLTWHDLRHSYAVYLIGAGVPIQLVAQSMGNSVRVCETAYAGFVLSDQAIDTIYRMTKDV